jgi:3-phosphoshikimate 1-carboxyvinyltransferase
MNLPGSKSITNRALLLSALAEGETRLRHALFSDDTMYFARTLAALGFEIRMDEERAEMTVSGQGGRIPAQRASHYIGNAGTAARFLTAFLTLGAGEFTLDGDARMRQRPIGDLIQALNALGAQVEAQNPNANPRLEAPPLLIRSNGLRGGTAHLRGDISSQFLSALLMTAPYAHQPVTLLVEGELNSRPYVEMTLRMMETFGVRVRRENFRRFEISPARYAAPESYEIEADASAASYFLAAPAILGGRTRIERLSRRSLQGDARFVDVLARMGCIVREGENWLEVERGAALRGVDVDLRDMPDVAQTLAVVAPFAVSPTRIRGIASARWKETDRIAAVCAELRRLGVRVEEHEDGLTIFPALRLSPARIQTYNDHRMAMAFGLIARRVPGVEIENPNCVSKTFPDYFKALAQLPPAEMFSAAARRLSLGLTGWPLEGSRSPALHAALLKEAGLEGEYRLYPLERAEELPALLERMRRGELDGLNITIPHKQAVLSYLDDLTPAALAIGAVNIVFRQGERLAGENTDAPGFLADARRHFPAVFAKDAPRALVFGSGGAARATTWALAQSAFVVTVVSRRGEELGLGEYSALKFADLAAWLSSSCQIDLIVNATSLGMAPSLIDRSPWDDALAFPPGAAVYDVVYKPPETRFLRQARAAGLPAVNGLGMLEEQARLAFQRWLDSF